MFYGGVSDLSSYNQMLCFSPLVTTSGCALASSASRPDKLCCLFPICSITAVSNIGHSMSCGGSGNGAAAGREMRQYRMVDNVTKGKTHM